VKKIENEKNLQKCWGEFGSPWRYFLQKASKKMLLAWCKAMKWLKNALF